MFWYVIVIYKAYSVPKKGLSGWHTDNWSFWVNNVGYVMSKQLDPQNVLFSY